MEMVIYYVQMSGYELNDKDIEVVLKHLRAVKTDATTEDAEQLLLKAKMDVRFKGLDNPDALIELYKEFNNNSD